MAIESPDTGPYQRRRAKNPVFGVVQCGVRLLLNRFKRAWAFSTQEITLFHATLRTLVDVLQRREIPKPERLIELESGNGDIQDIRAEQVAQLDLGRILVSRGMTFLQRPRRVNCCDYEAVGKSTHIQHILPVSDTSLSVFQVQ